MIRLILVAALVTYASCKSFPDGNINGLEHDNLKMVNFAKYLQSLRTSETNTTCTEIGQYYCKNCLTPAFCGDDGMEVVYPECDKGNACTEEFGISYCTAHTDSAKCECGSIPKLCDSYDQDSLVFCDSDGPFWIDPCADGETCSSGDCTTKVSTTTPQPTTPKPPVCTSSTSGLILLGPSCESAYYCNGETELSSTDCASGQYYDPDLGCQTAPPKACLLNCRGYCPDPVDCSKFHVCDGEGNVMTDGVCETGQYFNSDASPPQCEDYSGQGLPDYCPKTVVCTDYLY